MQTLQADHPSVKMVLDLLGEVGLTPMLMGSGVIVEGSVDPLKACKVKAFADHVTDDDGMIGRDTVRRGLLKGRRALLAYVVDTLVSDYGVELMKHEKYHDSSVDEFCELNVEGTKIELMLMPR